MYLLQNIFFRKINTHFYLKVPLWLSISQKNFGVTQFSEAQQFSEAENFVPHETEGGGLHGEVSWQLDYNYIMQWNNNVTIQRKCSCAEKLSRIKMTS